MSTIYLIFFFKIKYNFYSMDYLDKKTEVVNINL